MSFEFFTAVFLRIPFLLNEDTDIKKEARDYFIFRGPESQKERHDSFLTLEFPTSYSVATGRLLTLLRAVREAKCSYTLWFEFYK
jgi:hypothetical protein